jgi:hypothetical protein
MGIADQTYQQNQFAAPSGPPYDLPQIVAQATNRHDLNRLAMVPMDA